MFEWSRHDGDVPTEKRIGQWKELCHGESEEDSVSSGPGGPFLGERL